MYEWASVNNMRWNDSKFQVLRLGKSETLKEEIHLFFHDYTEVIERIEAVKDLGVMVEQGLDFKIQRQKSLTMT